MSRTELKVGDVVFYEGNRGVVRHIFNDGKENYYKIELTITSSRFLYADELDFSLDQPTLNENQQIVLEWLKKEYAERNLFPTEVAWLLLESVDNGYFEPEEERAFENLNKLQEAQVLQAFASWVEQEVE